LRRLERKKKHSAILHDELYQYLEKFPEEVICNVIAEKQFAEGGAQNKKKQFFWSGRKAGI
jgi:hypothetical protein